MWIFDYSDGHTDTPDKKTDTIPAFIKLDQLESKFNVQVYTILWWNFMSDIRWLINNGVDTVEIFGEPDENGWSGTAINGTSARNHTH